VTGMNIDVLTRLLEGEEDVVLGYLFGSHAAGLVGTLSDVDVAVFLDGNMSKADRFKLRMNLMVRLSSALRTSKVDVVVMNDASIVLNYEVIKHGKALVVKDPELKLDVESRILSAYLDWMYYERRSLDEFLEGVIGREAL
jgi:predicted nucleotidyltransferase